LQPKNLFPTPLGVQLFVLSRGQTWHGGNVIGC
jgi:hypothetical protein